MQVREKDEQKIPEAPSSVLIVEELIDRYDKCRRPEKSLSIPTISYWQQGCVTYSQILG